MLIDLSKTAVRREVHRLARGSHADKRRLLQVGYEAEFQNRQPAIVNGKLGTVPQSLLRDVTA
jgi:hypothetical protein